MVITLQTCNSLSILLSDDLKIDASYQSKLPEQQDKSFLEWGGAQVFKRRSWGIQREEDSEGRGSF